MQSTGCRPDILSKRSDIVYLPWGMPGICGTKGDNKLSKGKFLNIIFLIVEVIAFIRLTIEVFGDMNPDVLTISAVVFGIGLAGNCIFTIVGAIREMKKK